MEYKSISGFPGNVLKKHDKILKGISLFHWNQRVYMKVVNEGLATAYAAKGDKFLFLRKLMSLPVASKNQYASRACRPRLLLARPTSTVDLTIRLVSEHALARVHRRKFKEIHGKLFDTWDKYQGDEITTTQLLRRCSLITGLGADSTQSCANYLKLTTLNTPIHRWSLPGVPEGFQVFIKRDDLTGTELSGNKVRMLQILFAEALRQGARHVVTGGGPQSGHCRAVALTCRQLGLTPHVVVDGVSKKEELGAKGNTLLSRMAGSELYLSPPCSYGAFKQRVCSMAGYISAKYQEPCYCIPVGGATASGMFAFISLFQELIGQGLHENFDDIVVTIATGGTAAGIAVAFGIRGLIHEKLTPFVDRMLSDIGLSVGTDDIMDIVEGYIGEGYGTASDELLCNGHVTGYPPYMKHKETITNVSASTGILLDPYYTGKCAQGLLEELKKNPTRFQGKRILFIHTGGIFRLFKGDMDRVVNLPGNQANNINEWPESNIPLVQ
ncbi:hypothetical protein DPMN_093321 [Dreissena polymorpha]|uniref:Tryptophan synthase beta chain-like PALP domain-containing protein n=1 Tax=Dreissena polymorpha TaxID=45954 RepID=A0A9D4R0S6_DREPO|nr:hypothetical protein DPMN_093321 [Dreissena polymorpha]